jgi:hypothetical protein
MHPSYEYLSGMQDGNFYSRMKRMVLQFSRISVIPMSDRWHEYIVHIAFVICICCIYTIKEFTLNNATKQNTITGATKLEPNKKPVKSKT